jgi:CHAD domain-containing protein
MERVLEECDLAAQGFQADPVHDLRVALRRCRSLADGLMAMDSHPSWKAMKKEGRKLFRALGDLRDMQVMEEWIEKLARSKEQGSQKERSQEEGSRQTEDPVVTKLLNHLRSREAECKQLAWKDLNQFDRKRWRQWSRTLPARASRLRPGNAVYLHLALEKWTAAYELHKRAVRTRSQVALHELRIGIKRFRYTVENFLPAQRDAWGASLKELQDLLGEVHDLDVLWATAVEIAAFPDAQSRIRWREKINHERNRRIERYRELMIGKESLWKVWRAAMPSGADLRAAALNRLRVWAGYLDPNFAHAQRVAQISLRLYDALHNAGSLHRDSLQHDSSQHGSLHPTVPHNGAEHEARDVLQAAAYMHDVGKVKGSENHQKQSQRMILKLVPPLGWGLREQKLAAVVARYHRGALPRPRGKNMQMLDLPDRRIAMELAGVLRLANALDAPKPSAAHTRVGIPPRLEVETLNGMLVVHAEGYSPLQRKAETVAAARHLLETVLHRPVMVRGMAAHRA